MVPEVTVEECATALASGALVVDVREVMEYVAGHVAGSQLVPMAYVHSTMASFPRGERVYVICRSGNRSYTAADWMRSAGVDAVSVSGGVVDWAASGRALVAGREAGEPAA